MNIFETIATIFLWLIIYSCMGWIYESTLCSITNKKLTNRGMLIGPYCPIYGCGALAVLFTLQNVRHNLFALYLASMIVTTTLEYVTSYVLEKLFHTKWWDYSYMRFNINGRVCLAGALIFALLSVILVYYVHPHVVHFTASLDTTTLFSLSGILFVIFAIDIAYTLHNLIMLDKHIQKAQQLFAEAKAEIEANLQTSALQKQIEFETRITEISNRLNVIPKRFHHFFHAYPKFRDSRYFTVTRKLHETFNELQEKFK